MNSVHRNRQSRVLNHYSAPWGMSLLVISCLATGICMAVVADMAWSGRSVWAIGLPLAITATAALFTIRSYSVAPYAIIVRRLFWNTRVPLAGLQSVRFQPNEMRGSIRAFGNGGLFSISGFFRNKALGVYRAFVTDGKRTVVLIFPWRTIVLSPDRPEEFVRELITIRTEKTVS